MLVGGTFPERMHDIVEDDEEVLAHCCRSWFLFFTLAPPLRGGPHRDKAAVEKLRLQELKNGRLAMISVAACASEHWIKGAVPFLEGQGY